MADKKQVLILQHFQENPPGRVSHLLNEFMIPYDTILVGQDHFPDPIGYQAIIALGGPQHLYNKSTYPYTIHEEIYVHQAIKHHIPYLGMCLGGQLLANAFQAPVRKLPKEHIGFLEIHFTEAGQRDPLYHGLPSYQQAFQWHEDCFDFPAGAVPLAHYKDGSNQAFRFLDHAYGLQYHVELTEEILNTWLHDSSLKEEFIDAYGIEQYEKVVQEVAQLYPIYAKHSHIVIENFLRISKLVG